MKPGTRVSVLDEAISGVVTSVDNGTATIISSDGFEMQFQENELIVMGGISKKEFSQMEISQVLYEKEIKKPLKTQRTKPKERSAPPMEVDLHIHQLLPKSKGLSNYEMLTVQLEAAKRQLDFAISKKIRKVVFIHGVGEGVLRSELEFLFNRYENVKFYDADYQKYGRGAMEVYIFQSKTPSG